MLLKWKTDKWFCFIQFGMLLGMLCANVNLVEAKTEKSTSSLEIMPVEASQFFQTVGAMPFVNGPANLRDQPKGSTITGRLEDFDQVKVLDIRGNWFQIKKLSDDNQLAPVQGWTLLQNLRFLKSDDALNVTIFGQTGSDVADDGLKSVRACRLSGYPYAFLFFFHAWDMGCGNFYFVGKPGVFSVPGMQLGGRVSNFEIHHHELHFFSDAKCFENLHCHVSLDSLLSTRKVPRTIWIDSPHYKSRATVSLAVWESPSKTVTLTEGEDYALVALHFSKAKSEDEIDRWQLEIELLNSKIRVLLDDESLERVAPTGGSDEKHPEWPSRSCAG